MNSPISTPESEMDASVTFSEALMEQINREDVRNMVTAQRDMLCRFEKTNEMLINFNILSANRFAVANNELKEHTHLMFEMKKDLDSIFKRIRVLKDRLNKSYPDAFKVCNVSPLIEDDEEGEEELRISSTSQTSDEQSGTSQSLVDESITSQTLDDQSNSSQTFGNQSKTSHTSEDQSGYSSNQPEDNKLIRKDISSSETDSSTADGGDLNEETSEERDAERDAKPLDASVINKEQLVEIDTPGVEEDCEATIGGAS